MPSQYGSKIKISIFGQSHSPAIGVVIDGLPAGNRIDMEELKEFLTRRAPGNDETSTARKEDDVPEILSGLAAGYTCGAPLTAIIRNTDIKPDDYKEIIDTPRPSHADYTAYKKYGRYHDTLGGGHFSGRLTAPLCIAGGICLQLLKKDGIKIKARMIQVGTECSDPEKMRQLIISAKTAGDSVGGVIECEATGIPPGIGDPMFDGLENKIASVVFGIPGVKGIEFGNGFPGASLKGSENNDSFYFDGQTVKTRTNNCGGILGGITNGMPVLFRVAIKPTPSIAIPQESVNLLTGENTLITVKGRHDPCIVPRAVPCVEAAAAIAIYDAYLNEGICNEFK